MVFNTLSTGFLLLLSTVAYPQNRVSLFSYAGFGYSWFSGKGASSETDYYATYLPVKASYANNPFGSKMLTIGQAGLQVKLDFRNNWIETLNLQYEAAGGKSEIKNTVSPTGTRSTAGEYKRAYQFISINPAFGPSFKKNDFSIVCQAGVDYAFALTFSEEFRRRDSLTAFGGGIPKSNDVRLMAGITTSLKKWSLDFCYKHGLRNYSNESNAKVFSNLFQIRLMYRILQVEIG
ncbi:MAG TPA: hypothetical protein VFP87_12340 [Chitinophagaceae bacterium]|nr:hypothetical protein [Chitinophagaceae bacterium]